MGLRKALKKRRKLLFGVLILLITIVTSSIAKAENNTPDVKMVDGRIVFEVKTKAASSSNNIRYRTIGFTISMNKQSSKVNAGGIQGPEAPPIPNKELSLVDGEKEEVERTEEYVLTRYHISEARVKNAIKDIANLDDLSEDTTIYLNAIFETYQIVNGREVKRKRNITTWRDIVNAESWVDNTIFENYFNIPVKFEPGLQENELHFEINGVSKSMFALDKLKIGERLYWDNRVSSTAIINDINGTLIGYYARGKLDNSGQPDRVRKMVGDTIGGKKLTVNDIINDSVKVLYGGMDIYMIYEPLEVKIVIDAKDIDSNNNILLDMYSGIVEPGQNFKQSISNTIVVDGATYTKTEYFYYLYSDSANNLKKINQESNHVSDPIQFQIPTDILIPDRISVKVYYKKVADDTDDSDVDTDDITLRVTMVSSSGTFIEEISRETVVRGQAISKSIDSSRIVNATKYLYDNKWDYKYITSSGEDTKQGKGNAASFIVSPTTKLGSIINLRMYYEVEQSISVPEQQSPISLPIDTPSPQGIINADKYNSNYFISKDGISTTENQHVYIKTKEYLLGYRLVNRTGKIKFVVPVTMTYKLEYHTATPDEFLEEEVEIISDTVTDTQYISVERAYSYWEIERLEYFTPSSANVYNYSLPDGKVHLTTNESYLNIPSLMPRHSSDVMQHIDLPRQAQGKEGIRLTYPKTITSDTSDRPQVELVDLTSYAYEMTDELMVKNDYLLFDGNVVMSDTPMEKIAARPNVSTMYQSSKNTHDKLLYKEGLTVDALKKNGVYSSNGNVTYSRHPMSINASDSTKSFNMSINNVIIHTPVICDPIIHSDNDRYVQLLKPTEGAYHMVLDPDTSLNDFTVRISNKLTHSARLGYYERDFSRSFIDPANVSYVAKTKGVVRNEMKLPFDVYLDRLNDKEAENDEFIKAGTWIVLGRETHRFYVPMWVKEGTYTVEFRTVAVNGEDRLDNTETTRNANFNNYVATASRIFQVSGRLYGLTLYDLSDDGRWGEVFRVKDSTQIKYFEGYEDGTKKVKYNKDYAYNYKVGINDQYGYQTGRYLKFTLPILNGSHPQFKNLGVTKTGYAIRFRLDTIGEMYGSGCMVRIIPSFYHVDEEGKNRQLVDIYYDEEINGKEEVLVKIGEGMDLVHLQSGSTANPYSKIPEKELRDTAKVMETTYGKIGSQHGPMYSYGDICITNKFRTFIGGDYACHIEGLPSFDKLKEVRGQTGISLSKYMQRWYGTYKLPTNIHVVPSGYDVNSHLRKYGIDYQEDFWLKDGYIIVNFNIETYDKDGNRNLSYTNGYNYTYKNHCSMWVLEGGQAEKEDSTGAKFRLYAGDVMFYYTGKKHSDDYMGRLY